RPSDAAGPPACRGARGRPGSQGGSGPWSRTPDDPVPSWLGSWGPTGTTGLHPLSYQGSPARLLSATLAENHKNGAAWGREREAPRRARRAPRVATWSDLWNRFTRIAPQPHFRNGSASSGVAKGAVRRC